MKIPSRQFRRFLGLLFFLVVATPCAMSFFARTTLVLGWQSSVGAGGWSALSGVIFTDGGAVFMSGDRELPGGGPVIRVGEERSVGGTTRGLRGRRYIHLAESSDRLWRRSGAVAPTGLGIDGRNAGLGSAYSVPSPILAATAGAAPFALGLAMRLIARHRASEARRLSAASICPTCNYDLRATPDRCPECGRKASETASR